MGEKTERKTVTMPIEHVKFYEDEVRRQRGKGIKTSFADLVRKAIENDVRRLKRQR